MDSVLKYCLSHMTSRQVSQNVSLKYIIELGLCTVVNNNVNFDHKLTGSKLITDTDKMLCINLCMFYA